jgi:hypothetical protein
MSISLTLLLVVVGIALVAFGIGSTGGAIRFLSGGFALVVAIAASAATIGLFWLGHRAHWTSDGPGMLFVMIALVVCAIVAAVGWMIAFGVASGAGAPLDALPEAPPAFKRVLLLLGCALLAIAAIGQGIAAYARRGRTAHASPVVAVSLARGTPRLVSLDAAGSFVDWDLHSKREHRRDTIRELAGATELHLDATVASGYAIANGQAVRFEPFAHTSLETIPGARHLARGVALVVATERSLLFVSYSDWTKPPYRELAWPETILAIAANDGLLAVADRRSLSLLDGRPQSARTLASVPTPGAIRELELLYDGRVLALDASGASWAVDVRRGVTEAVTASPSLVAGAGPVYFVSGRVVSEYDPRKQTATAVASIASGARSIDAWDKHVALGFEDGEVVLGTRLGPEFETTRLTARPRDR